MSVPPDFRRGIICGDPEHQIGSHASFTVVYGDSRLKCLKCYTEDSIRVIDEAIALLDMASVERRFLEFFYQTKSFKAQLDPSGRFILPRQLKDKARIGQAVWFAGKGSSFELWNPEFYDSHCEELETQFREGGTAMDPLALLDSEI